LADVSAMLGEARIQLDRRPAIRPVDVARAISRIGVARGINTFVRYGYLERNGQSTLAVPLGRIDVHHHPRAYLIDDIAGWMDQIGRLSRDKNAPAHLVHAERRLADSVFSALTHDATPSRWQSVLLAAADIEVLQATGTAIEAGPMPALNPDWVYAIDDGSPEFRLALALGSAAAEYPKAGRPKDSVRHHVLPLELGSRRFQIREKRLVNDPRVVVSGRDPIRDLVAIVERRIIEAEKKGQRCAQLVAAPGCGTHLGDVAQFLSDTIDMPKLIGLARALMATKWDKWSSTIYSRPRVSTEAPDAGWLAIRLAFLPWPIDDKTIPTDPSLVPLLNSGNAGRAIEVACCRLRASGIRPPMQGGVASPQAARRWAASLAFPIDYKTATSSLKNFDPRLNPKKGN
jgi:CRISPR-associated protein Csx17